VDRSQEGGHRVHRGGARHHQDAGIRCRGAPHFSGSQEGGGEKKYEERHTLRLDQYYDEVISQIGQPDALLLFGPGEAKLQLEDRLGRSQASSERIVAVETTDKLTDPQVVAKVKEHYGIAR
jgi:hypothetical protein